MLLDKGGFTVMVLADMKQANHDAARAKRETILLTGNAQVGLG